MRAFNTVTRFMIRLCYDLQPLAFVVFFEAELRGIRVSEPLFRSIWRPRRDIDLIRSRQKRTAHAARLNAPAQHIIPYTTTFIKCLCGQVDETRGWERWSEWRRMSIQNSNSGAVRFESALPCAPAGIHLS